MKNEKIKNKNKRNIITIVALSIATVLTLSACTSTDVIGKIAKTSFAEVLVTIPDRVFQDDVHVGWSLISPDETERFFWSEDYSKSSLYDIMIEMDATPFLNAGLDVSKLPEGTVVDEKIILGTNLGDDEITYDGEVTAEASFNKIVELYRASVGYHEDLDHYNVDLGGGNKFEWAKDMSTNDKDIVFVVDPEIFIVAGVNPENIEGWTYASVEVMDDSGKPIEVMKLLKFFDLK